MNQSHDQSQDPYKGMAYGFAGLICITPILLVAIAWYGSNQSQQQQEARFNSVVASASIQVVSPEALYKNTCMVCHGADGQGVARLGKPLRNSAYVQSVSDSDLFDLIADGRMADDPLNTSGTMMPARGAKNITDEEVHAVVSHLRSMQNLDEPTVSVTDWDRKPDSDASSADNIDGLDVVGKNIFVSSCSSCHGEQGEGMEGLGKPFTTSEFVAKSTDKELTTMIKMGRPIWDAANTTGIDMPPKGGNPALSDDELKDIITYIRSISTIEE